MLSALAQLDAVWKPRARRLVLLEDDAAAGGVGALHSRHQLFKVQDLDGRLRGLHGDLQTLSCDIERGLSFVATLLRESR